MLNLHGKKWAQAWAAFLYQELPSNIRVSWRPREKGLWITDQAVGVSKGGVHHSANRRSTIPWWVPKLCKGGRMWRLWAVRPQGCVLPPSRLYVSGPLITRCGEMSWLGRARGRKQHRRPHRHRLFAKEACSKQPAAGSPLTWLGRQLSLQPPPVAPAVIQRRRSGCQQRASQARRLPHPRVVAKIGQMNHTLKMPVSLCWLSRETRVTSSAVDTYTAQIKGRIQLKTESFKFRHLNDVSLIHKPVRSGCCSQWSWEKGTLEAIPGHVQSNYVLTFTWAACVLAVIWHSWRHQHLNVYSRCLILPQRL